MPIILSTPVSAVTPQTATNIVLTTGAQGPRGPDGKDAYKLALANGFVGTVNEWLDSLKGKDAYRIALANGFVGTFEEWVLSWGGIKTSPADAMKILTNDGAERFWIDIMDARLGITPLVEAKVESVIDTMIDSGRIASTTSVIQLVDQSIETKIDTMIDNGQIITLTSVEPLVREFVEIEPLNLDYGWITTP